ncbi:hypothetical protein GobsT_23960 [Gemmata obscuriglobus]|uniref:hypothetical protein n=1 Tax=Gemmata obscuriglobus TaxID=114 RepID=UPI00016C5550|nr:hypothetical protein [Gemmata obscuriglobus]QEG27637.1 hypothetical protein GobsT_23960 [Gemmata obscuriglobus]VTS04797.1 unnamed protein product [Gemmata obscuriglobus UQM 2246]
MLRSLTVSVVGAALTWSLPVALSPIAVAPAAPVPAHLMKSAPQRYYFPIWVGTTCVYDSDGDEERVTVTKVEPQGAAFIVTTKRTHKGSPSGVEERRVTSASVLRISSEGVRLPDPVPEVLTPFKVGDVWGEIRQPGRSGGSSAASRR